MIWSFALCLEILWICLLYTSSGGQKQRLAIARAIAKDPKIFIFDDSFSALDLKTDVALRKALAENVKDSTVIIVAQRISTILHAEQILVLDDGKVVVTGTVNQHKFICCVGMNRCHMRQSCFLSFIQILKKCSCRDHSTVIVLKSKTFQCIYMKMFLQSALAETVIKIPVI